MAQGPAFAGSATAVHADSSTRVDQPAPATETSQRIIRVFVSSTFHDMKAERDELTLRTFPQLRKLCEERGVSWGEVDLRWGITEEQTAEGRMLPICLAQIERCHCFIGLIGERYGSVPEEIESGLIERHRWLSEYIDRSVTELEIVHGVLRDSAPVDKAFLYLRDPAYVESRPTKERRKLLERPSDEEIERFGVEEAERRAEERRAKLADLMTRIRAGDFPVEENYPDPKALGELVRRDLGAVIDQLYPEGSEPEPLEREAAEHEAFARSRAAVYIGRQDYFERLDTHARAADAPLVILGESGVGKSALLSNWALRYRVTHPDTLVLMHFIGSSPYSSDWAPMLRRIMAELARRFRIEDEIPNDPGELRQAFANWLHMASARGKVILVLDALNQLENRESALDLAWLPPQIPANVRLVLSTLPGRPLEELTKRGWPTLGVAPLSVVEREELITEYLRQSGRALGPAHLKRITEARQSANPLYLRALLEELRVWGDHERLGDRIDHYLNAVATDQLYELILDRYETDYEDRRPGLVRDAMSLIWASRRGLSEAELLDLLGSDGEPLPFAHWSPLYMAAEHSLARRSGLIGFSHDYLRRAVENAYVSGENDQRAAHLRLADYFDARREQPRALDELPWQLGAASSWRRVYDLLADLRFFERAWETDEFDAKAHWARVEANSSLRIVDAYRPLLDQPARDPGQAWRIGSLLHDTGHLSEARGLRGYLIEHHRQSGDRHNLQASLGNQALVLRDRGELNEAMALLKEAKGICRELGYWAGLQSSLVNQAVILRHRGELDEAMALLGEAERIARELGDRERLGTALGNQAVILYERGELDEAMALHKEEERICRELGDRSGLHFSLGNQALILKDRGRLDEAMALHKEEERICRELGDRSGLQRSLGNQALILRDRGELDEAMALHEEEERICRELDNPGELARSLGNQAGILRERGELGEAMALLTEAERLFRQPGDRDGLRRTIENRAAVLVDLGKPNEVLVLLKEVEAICRELGDPVGVVSALTNQAVALTEIDRPDEAVARAEEAYRLATDRGLAGETDWIRSVLEEAMLKRRRKRGSRHEDIEVVKVSGESLERFVAEVERCMQPAGGGRIAVSPDCVRRVVAANRETARVFVAVNSDRAQSEPTLLVGGMIVARAYEQVFKDGSLADMVRRQAVELGVGDEVSAIGG